MKSTRLSRGRLRLVVGGEAQEARDVQDGPMRLRASR